MSSPASERSRSHRFRVAGPRNLGYVEVDQACECRPRRDMRSPGSGSNRRAVALAVAGGLHNVGEFQGAKLRPDALTVDGRVNVGPEGFHPLLERTLPGGDGPAPGSGAPWPYGRRREVVEAQTRVLSPTCAGVPAIVSLAVVAMIV